jgi:hypothetical protein
MICWKKISMREGHSKGHAQGSRRNHRRKVESRPVRTARKPMQETGLLLAQVPLRLLLRLRVRVRVRRRSAAGF